MKEGVVMPYSYDFRFRNPYAEAEEYSRKIREDFIRAVEKPYLPEPQQPAPKNKVAAVDAVSGKKKLGLFKELGESWKAGEAMETLTKISAERVERDDPTYGQAEHKKASQELYKHKEGLPDPDHKYKGVIDRLTSRNYYKGLIVSLPLMDDIMAKRLIRGVEGTALMAGGAAMTTTGVVGGLLTAPTGVGAAAGAGLTAVGAGMVAAGAGVHGYAATEAAREESRLEKGGIYQDMFDKMTEAGKSPEEAHEVAREAAMKGEAANLLLVGGTNAIEQVLTFGAGGTAIRTAGKAASQGARVAKAAEVASKAARGTGRFAGAVGSEAAQEMGQEMIGQWATGEKVDPFAPEVREAGWAGAGMGGIFFGLGATSSTIMQKALSPKEKAAGAPDHGVNPGELGALRFPRISEIDPALEKGYLAQVKGLLIDERKTIADNKINAYLETGMEEKEAVFRALDDMMAQDKGFQKEVYGAYVDALKGYQAQSEEMFDRFAIYGAVLNSLPQEHQDFLQGAMIDLMQGTEGNEDATYEAYEAVMLGFLESPEGNAALEGIGLQDGSFWRQRGEELMNEYASVLSGAPFIEQVEFFEKTLADPEAMGAEGVADLLRRIHKENPVGGVDAIDALYDRGNIERGLVDEVAQKYIEGTQREQPELFEAPAQEQVLEQAQKDRQFASDIRKHGPFVPKYRAALREHTPEQSAAQQDLENAMQGFLNEHPILRERFSDFISEANAFVVDLTKEQAKVQELVKKAFGHDVVFFEANPVIEEYGAPSGAFSNKSGTVFVNVNSKNPTMAVIGHELTHAMFRDKTFNKGVFKDFLVAVQNAGIKDAEYVQGLIKMVESGEDITAESVEMAGDIMGHALNSEEFWSGLRKESPRAFEQLYNALKKMIAEIRALFTDVVPEHDMRQMFNEFDSLVSMAEKVAAEYSRHQQKQAVVRTHSVLTEGASGHKSQKQTFFVYDKETDQPIWRAETPGAAGRTEALEVARRINEGEATPEDIVAEYGEVESVRKKGETDRKLAAEERQVAEAEEAKKVETDAFAPGTIHIDPRGDKVKVVEQRENTVKIIKTEKENSKSFWVAKKHLKPYTENELIFGGEIYAGARELENRAKQSGIPSSIGRAEEIWDVRDRLSGLREENDRQVESGRQVGRKNKENAGNMVKRLKPQVAQVLGKKKTGASDIYGIGEPSAFFDALKQAKDKTEHGPYVELKSPEEYAGMKLFLTEGGHSGVAVTPDGDIVSLFNNKQESGVRRGSTQLLLNALSEGGKKLDNYDGNLSDIYEQHGFIPVVKVRFDEEFTPPGWKKEWGQPYIIFWVHNGDNPAEVAQKIWNYPVHNLDKVPVVDSGKESYDKAAQIRDELLQRLEESRKDETPVTETPVPETPTKLALPTQEEIDNELGEVFEFDEYGKYYWYDVIDWMEEMAEEEDSVSMQINLAYLEAALEYAKEVPTIKADAAEGKGFTEKYTLDTYNKEQKEAIRLLKSSIKKMQKKVKALPPEEILAESTKEVLPQDIPDPPVVEMPGETEPTDEGSGKKGKVDIDDITDDFSDDEDLSDLLDEFSDIVGEGNVRSRQSLDSEARRIEEELSSYESLLGDDDFDFQSARREIPYYQRARAVLEKNNPAALPELEKIKDNPHAIREFIGRLAAEQSERLDKANQQRAQREAEEKRVRKESLKRLAKTEELLKPNKEKRAFNAKQLEKAKKMFDIIKARVDKGEALSSKKLAQLEKVFAGYNETMAPASIEDSVPIRVLRRLGLELEMGIDTRRNYDSGKDEIKYFWSISGNIATYGRELFNMGARYNDATKRYEWVSSDPADSPLSAIMDKFGGEEYVEKAQRATIELGGENEKGSLTGTYRRTDVVRHGRTIYATGTAENPRKLRITKGIKTKKRTEIKCDENTWNVLEEHQKDGVSLAVEALDNHGAFILADGTGAGKTAQMLAVAEHYSRNGESVLIVLHDEKSFREAFVRDAKLLGIPTGKLHFMAAKKNSAKRSKMKKGAINAVVYNYFSVGDESILDKLGMAPDLIVFDESHNMKKADKDSKKADIGRDLSLLANKAMFATATIAEDTEQLMYLEKLGFLDHYDVGLADPKASFLQRMGYVFVDNKEGGYWRSANLEYTAGQLELFYNELADAGLLLKRELSLEGVNIGVRKYDIDESLRSSMDQVANIVESKGINPYTKAKVLMAQRRYLETQKIQEAYNLALEEMEKGRQVLIFAGQVNPTSMIKGVREQLMSDWGFVKKASEEARRRGRHFGTKRQKEAFVEEMLQEELAKRQASGGIPDGPGTLTELAGKFDAYFREKQGKGPYYNQVAKIFGGGKVEGEIENYQSGVAPVALATIQKGGTSVSLDDQHGDRPRTVIFMTPPFSAIETMQALGRVWRLTTKSDVDVMFLKADHPIDDWGFEITYRKLKMLGAIGQADATKTYEALATDAAEGGALSALERRKLSDKTPAEPGAIPEFQQDWRARQRFKYADSTARKAVSEANQTLGVTRRDKDRITYAADGWTPEMELADKAAVALSGTSIIPVKMPSFMSRALGFFERSNGKIFINKDTEDPVTYVALHETGHRMKETHPKHYARIEKVAIDNLKEEHSELIKRYTDRDYTTDEMPEEFVSDLVAEMLHDKSFISKLREQAPEVIKPLLDVLDEVISKIKLALSKDDSVLPFIENLERLRSELAPEYVGYLKTVQSEKETVARHREGWGKAAKVGSKAATNTPEFKKWFGNSKVVDEKGKPLVVYHGSKDPGFGSFEKPKIQGTMWHGTGFYFDSSKNHASSYAGLKAGQLDQFLNVLGEGAPKEGHVMGVYPVYLKMGNPLEVTSDWDAEFTKGLKANEVQQAYDQYLTEHGHDGVIADFGKHKEYMVREPNQIKSIYNKGTFDSENPDINFQQDWRARQKAAMEKAEKTRSLKDLHQAQKEYYQGEIQEAKESGNEARAAELEETQQIAADGIEVLESVKKNAMDFFVDSMVSEAKSSRSQLPSRGKRKQENIWDYIKRIYRTRRNDPDKRELALVPASELIEDRKGAGFSIDRGHPEAAGMEIMRSVDNIKVAPLEKFLIKDNLMNTFLLGDIQYREDAEGKPLTAEQKQKYFAMMAYYKFMRNGIDDKVALRLIEELACGELNEADKSIYKLARMYGGIETRTFYGLIRDFQGISKLLTDEEGAYSDEMEVIVGKLATASHALDVNKFFREQAESKTEDASGFTDEQIQEVLDEARAQLAKLPRAQQEKARKAQKELVAFHRRLLNDMLEGEVITQKTYDTLTQAYPNYVPMFRHLRDNRVIDFDPTKPAGLPSSLEGTIEPLMNRKGSTRPVQDILTSSLEAYSRARRATEMNAVLRNLDHVIDGLEASGLKDKLVKRHRNIPVLREFYAIKDDGTEVPADNFTQEDLEMLGVGTVICSKSKDVANYVVAKEKGEIILYEAHPEIIAAIQTMRKQAYEENNVWKFFRACGDVLRTGATTSPEFIVKNPIRDAFHGYITSDSGVAAQDIAESAVFMLGGRDNARLQQLWQEFLEDGGGMGNILNDIITRHNNFYKEVTGRKALGDFNPIRGLQNVSHTAENISRFTEYVKARETGTSRKEAAFRAMDQMDFGMAGKTLRPINSIVPFFNAGIQGKYKLFRKFKQNPKAFFERALWAHLPFTMFSIAARFFASDDQRRRIEEAHSYIRVNYWLIPVPGKDMIIRIPKPFDASMLFANTIESFFDYATTKDSMAVADAVKNWAVDNLQHTVLPNTMFPQALNIFAEWQTGYKQFYGMDSVPASLSKYRAMDQYTSLTPHLCIAWGRAMGAMGLGDRRIASPVAVQSLIDTTFGGLGTMTLDLIDMAWNGLTWTLDAMTPNTEVKTYRERTKGQAPSKENWVSRHTGIHVNIDKLPMLRVFLQTTDYGKSVNEVYRKWGRLKKQKAVCDTLAENGQLEAAIRAMPQKDWDLYHILKITVDIDQTIGDENRMVRTFRDTTHLDAAEKAYWTDIAEHDRWRMAREALVFIKLWDAGATPDALLEEAEKSYGMSGELKEKLKVLDKAFEKHVEDANKEALKQRLSKMDKETKVVK